MRNTPKNLSLLLLLVVATLHSLAQSKKTISKSADTTTTATFKFKTIVIDPGHGGKDSGAPGAHSFEKNVALAIGKKLRDAINDQLSGVNVLMTRSDDTFIPLARRSEMANEKNGNLFISIHCDSSPVGTGWSHKGPTLLIYALKRSPEQYEAIRENASINLEKDYKTKYAGYDESNPANRIILNLYMQKYRKQAIMFGELVNNEFRNNDGRKSSVKEQSVLVLAHAAMPSVLVETGYINNEEEEKYLNSDAGQDAIVRSILSAIKTYKKEISF